MVWKIRHSALAALAAATLASPAAAQREIVTDGPYVHAAAHADYPPRVGEFRRSDIYQFDDKGDDVSASYNLATPEGRLLITVYIYPAPPAAAAARAARCDEEFETVKAAISSQHGNATSVEEGGALAVAGVRGTLARRAVYRFSSPFDDRVQPLRSEAHLYCYAGGDWFVKYRVSAPAAVETRRSVEAFIRSGPWPGRSSPATVVWEEPPSRRSVEAPKQSGELQ